MITGNPYCDTLIIIVGIIAFVLIMYRLGRIK